MSENMNQRRGDARATWPLCWVEVDSLEALRRVVRDDAYAAAFQNLAQYRDALLQHLKKWAVAESARQGAVRTWRQRIGVGKDWPLHAPNDVERAMVAEIAELRTTAASAEGPLPRTELSKRIREAATADVTMAQAKLLIGAAEEIERAQHAAAPGALALLNADEMAALRRFDETCQDGEGYDVPKAMMQRLAAIGVVRRTTGSFYEQTSFGLHALGQPAPSAPGTPEAPQIAAMRGIPIECSTCDAEYCARCPVSQSMRAAQLDGGQGEQS